MGFLLTIPLQHCLASVITVLAFLPTIPLETRFDVRYDTDGLLAYYCVRILFGFLPTFTLGHCLHFWLFRQYPARLLAYCSIITLLGFLPILC